MSYRGQTSLPADLRYRWGIEEGGEISFIEMTRLAGRHPRLNLMNLEAVALGHLRSATVWLSDESAGGILPTVLDHEHVRWRSVTIE